MEAAHERIYSLAILLFESGRGLLAFAQETVEERRAGVAENPSQNRKLFTIGNAHPLQRTQRMGHPPSVEKTSRLCPRFIPVYFPRDGAKTLGWLKD
jgi:hypothetical protein